MLEAHGGAVGGAATPSGQRVIVRLDRDVLTVFTETDTHVFHAGLVEHCSYGAAPGQRVALFSVRTPRGGVSVPVAFPAEAQGALWRIVQEVAAY